MHISCILSQGFESCETYKRAYKPRCGGLCKCVRFKFPGVCLCRTLDEFDDILS